MAGKYTNEAYVVNIHWSSGSGNAEFIVLYSDFTWEKIECPCGIGTMIGDKTLKQHLNLNKIVSGHRTKEELYSYIEQKFKEL